MPLVDTIAGTRPWAQESVRLADGRVACDRCGIRRHVGGGANDRHNLCQSCSCQLTPAELKAWEL